MPDEEVLEDPRNFRHGQHQWWGAHVQTYAMLRGLLPDEGLHQHHLLPKSLLLCGPPGSRSLVDYVPSVPLAQSEHLRSLHAVLNRYLESYRLWQRALSSEDLAWAIELTARFYERAGLPHYADAVREFQGRVYNRFRKAVRC